FAQNIAVDKEKLLDFYQSQRYAEAAQYLQSIYPNDTQDVKALSQMAYCNMMAGKLPDAEKNYLKINTIQPNTLPVLFSLFNINARRGNKAKAKSYLEEVVKIDSTNFNAYKQIADYAETDSLKLLYLKKANTINNTDADVAYELADQYNKSKMYQPAYDALAIAINADTSNFVLQQALLPIALQLNKYKEVVTNGERMLQASPNPKVLSSVARAYFFLKNYPKALSLFNVLEESSMQNETIFYFMSICYRELKNYEKATAYAKKTIEEGISGNTPLYYSLLGGILEERNQNQNAASAYKRGLTFDAYNTLYYRLGLLYDLKLNQSKNAVNYYNLYLKSKPDLEKEKQQIDYTKDRIATLTAPKVAQK
ncbi:MAG: hypothetical protein EOO47_17735, partial [Flavobacterium sp.]